jgi:DNA-binding MarR family transcriptional regulator
LKTGQALKLWQQVSLEQVLDDLPDLTLRQLTILLIVYLEPPHHTVKSLSTRLNVTKPVVTRAIDTMGLMGLVKRRRSEEDRRIVLIQRTVEGSMYLEKLGDIIVEKTRGVENA